MRNSLFRFLVAALVGCAIMTLSNARADEPKDEKARKPMGLAKTTGDPRYQVLNINNIQTWHTSNGECNFPPSRVGDGLVYPRGTGSLIYRDGLVWGGKVFQDAAKTIPGGQNQPIRAGGNEYVQGNQPGRIVGSGATAVAADQNLPEVRIYRIRRDWNAMTEDELKRDAGEWNEISPAQATADQIATIKAQYQKDWDEWPVSLGAPYIERNGTPGYQKPPRFNYDPTAGPLFTHDHLVSGKHDEPGVAGADPNIPADMVLWTVYNDLNRALTTATFGSEPMGIEGQTTYWGYKRTDALGNCVFRRIRIINKGGVQTGDVAGVKGSFYIDSMYVGMFSDPDLGNAGDDLIGCDTTLSLSFVYNGTPIDGEYAGYNLAPPSAGYDFLAGPMVPGAPGDIAVWDFKRISGKKNIPMTGFSYFSAGSAISDPRPRTWSLATLRWWKMFRGFAPIDGPDVRYPFPPGITPGPFPLSGDPVTGKGFIDGLGLSYAMSPGDRRMISMSGPFTLAPGDTQEVVVATVVGLGADRFSSISVLKFNDQFAQNTFDALFVVPVATTPKVISTELDGSVVLDWGWDPETVAKVEGTTIEPGSFAFEGYNIYQLPTQGGALNSGRRLATFDVINSYSVLLDETFDEASGLIIQKPVQFGTNSGVKKVYEFKADALGDHPTLYNGREYYLAVTAYFRATKPGFLPQVLESAPARVRGTPQKPFPGTKYNAKIGETITVSHPAGNAEGSVVVNVIDPSRLSGDTYRVTFTGAGAGKTYSIVNVTKNKTLFFGGRNYGEDWGGMADDYPTADGMVVKVTEGAGVSNAATVWSGGAQWIDGTLYWGDPYSGFKESVLPGAKAGDHLGQYAPSFPLTSIYPVEIRFDAANPQKAYRIVRHSTYTENVYKIGKSFGSTSKDTLPVINVPFTVWDVSKTPHRQLTVSVRDNNRNGVWDCASGEFFNIYNKTYDPTMTQFGTTMKEYQTPNIATGGPTADIVYIVDLKIATGQTMSGSVGTLKIFPKLPFTTTDQFTFSPGSKKAEYGNVELAKEEVNKINVFPNPYYALNASETNRFSRFVTFSHLPANCTIRIFNLAGHLVRSIVKDGASNPTQFQQWDLTNQYGFPVASGVYIAHIDMPDLGTTKVLKVAVIQEQEVLQYY
ncbi:MAG: T9SS type A sorting domain-containing protein [Ignavibacteria bacterium]|nr:T9SS type A sorting domain-containing protein [Ignavibacteria bacterium]